MESKRAFVLSAYGTLNEIFPLERGTVNFFLCQKEKSCKKEVGDLAGRTLSSVEIVYCKAPSHASVRYDSAREHNADALLLLAWRKGVSPLVVL